MIKVIHTFCLLSHLCTFAFTDTCQKCGNLIVTSINGLAVTVAGGGTISLALGLKESLQRVIFICDHCKPGILYTRDMVVLCFRVLKLSVCLHCIVFLVVKWFCGSFERNARAAPKCPELPPGACGG